MADKPTINDLRALASMLPPSERVFAGEVSDVLSAVVNVVAHGPGLLEAAKDGLQAVYDFNHQEQVDKAKELGADEPIKGNPVHSGAAPVTTATPSQAPQIDYDQLAAAMIRAQEAHQQASAAQKPEPAETSPPAGDVTPPAGDVTPPSVDTPAAPSEGLL